MWMVPDDQGQVGDDRARVGRIGCIGFGGPPAHIALLRDLCVRRRKWLDETEFEHGIAVTNLLPCPASTQLAIPCAWRLRSAPGALVGGVCFIVPGLVLILRWPRCSSRPPAPAAGWYGGRAPHRSVHLFAQA